jgi:hypothetical protein
MSKEDAYWQNAAHSIQLAQRATSTADKGRLLTLAQLWLQLAKRAKSYVKEANPTGERTA